MARKLCTFVLTALVLAPLLMLGRAQASDFSYTYLGGGYFNYSPSGGSSGSGPFFDGSYNFQSTNRYLSHMNILADYSHASYGGGVSGNNYDIGLGGHFGLRSFPHLNILVRILYLHEEFSVSTPFGSLSASANGLGFAGGVRWQPLRRVEFDGLLEHDDYGCTGCTSYTTLGAQGQYYFTPHLTGLVGVTVGDDSYGDLFRVGVRYYF